MEGWVIIKSVSASVGSEESRYNNKARVHSHGGHPLPGHTPLTDYMDSHHNICRLLFLSGINRADLRADWPSAATPHTYRYSYNARAHYSPWQRCQSCNPIHLEVGPLPLLISLPPSLLVVASSGLSRTHG